LTWASYLWSLEILDLSPPTVNALLLGGVGLSLGFIIRILFNVPGWLAALLTAVLTWSPIYITFTEYLANSKTFNSLMYFDPATQVFSVAIPMVIFIALGANARALLAEASFIYRKFKPHKITATA
jgi:hypothetical protein